MYFKIHYKIPTYKELPKYIVNDFIFYVFEPLWHGVSERGSSLLSFRHYHTLAFVVASGQVSHMDAKFLRNL